MKKKVFIKNEVLILALIVILTISVSIGVVKYYPKNIKFDKAEKTANDISLDWELKFKKSMMKYLKRDSKIVDNVELNLSVNKIKDRLLTNIENNPYDIEILIVNSSMVNAFAFPGGLIVLYTPLIRSTENAEELSAVIAHEMGHIINRDPLQRLVRQLGVSTVMSMLGGAGESTVFFGNIINNLINANYNQVQEDSADQFALELMEKSSINPINSKNFLLKLDIDKKEKTIEISKHFMSHPDTKSRIEKADLFSKDFTKEEKLFDINWDRVKRLLPSVFD